MANKKWTTYLKLSTDEKFKLDNKIVEAKIYSNRLQIGRLSCTVGNPNKIDKDPWINVYLGYLITTKEGDVVYQNKRLNGFNSLKIRILEGTENIIHSLELEDYP